MIVEVKYLALNEKVKTDLRVVRGHGSLLMKLLKIVFFDSNYDPIKLICSVYKQNIIDSQYRIGIRIISSWYL
jgi:hypothetical protein